MGLWHDNIFKLALDWSVTDSKYINFEATTGRGGAGWEKNPPFWKMGERENPQCYFRA
jgi:hypothetical protein